MSHPRGNIPVNKPDIIAVLVFTHFLKQHAPSLKGRVVLTREEQVGEFFGFDFQLTDFF